MDTMPSKRLLTGKELLQEWFERVWNKTESAAINEMFDGGIVEGLGAQTNLTTDEFKVFHGAICGLLSDIKISIDRSMEDGVWTSALCTLKAIAKETGKEVVITGNLWARIEGGKILEGYNHFDFLGLWSQLGYLPEDSFEQGLQGQKIV